VKAVVMIATVQHPVAQLPVVLLVDDHVDSRTAYTFALAHSGFRVEEAATAAQALQRVAKTTPDVVVTDLRLPDSDALTLCRTLKEAAPTRDVPIIALTGHADPETARTARAAGCVSVLVKPCLPYQLRAEIAHVLAASHQVRRRGQAALERADALSRKSAALKARSERVYETAARYLQTSTEQLIEQIDEERVRALTARVRAEFHENPGLQLSATQAARFLGLDETTAWVVLESLTRDGFLRKATSGRYAVAADG
jgi:CheY-like chemotaxis protein